jgi:hypothetical protein
MRTKTEIYTDFFEINEPESESPENLEKQIFLEVLIDIRNELKRSNDMREWDK